MATSKRIFEPAKTRHIIASNLDFISESDHRVCSFIEYVQEYSSDFRNFKNWMVFRLVVKYSIETTENWFGHARVFLAIMSIESVAKQHFTGQKDILIYNKYPHTYTYTCLFFYGHIGQF